jgi:hypothetical protein
MKRILLPRLTLAPFVLFVFFAFRSFALFTTTPKKAT